MRYALLVAYDGARYFGFVRQPGRATVEGELLGALRRCGLFRKLREAGYRMAARTDRGVSAVGQVVALDVLAEPVVEEINAILPEDISVLAASEVRSDFNPRTQARSRHYRYICHSPADFDLRAARRGAELLEGEHDFGHFCKHERGRTTVGRLDHANVRRKGDVLVFDFISPAFLWQQVRRMVWALLAVGTGGLSLDDLRRMIDGRAGPAARPAQAEGLFLVGVRYPSLVLRPDPSAAPRFMEHLRRKAHPVYREMLHLILAEKGSYA